MRLNKKIILSISLIVSISSCTIQKRTFRNGYHIEWNKKIKNSINENSSFIKEEIQNENLELSEIQIENPKVNSFEEFEKIDIESVNQINNDKPKIAESNKNTILLKEKSLVNQNVLIIKSNKKAKFKEKKNPTTANGGKLQIVALILCILLGLIGVHRFYLGYTGLGILYLFTLGLFGIGWLIDLILLIIPNGLTPKGKSNYKE